MFDFETKLRHLRSLRPTRRGAAGKRSKRQRTTAFEFLEERCCPSTISDLWIGGATGNYSIAANWNNGVSEQHRTQTTYDVEIPSSATVSMDITATIGNLTIDAGSSLNIQGGQSCYRRSGSTTGSTRERSRSASAAARRQPLRRGQPDQRRHHQPLRRRHHQPQQPQLLSPRLLRHRDPDQHGQPDPGPGLHLPTGLVPEPGALSTPTASGGTLSIYAVPTHQHRDARSHRRRHAPDLRLDRHQHGHTISADSTSNLILNAATINGGNLTAASPAVIHGIDDTTLNGVTITSGTTYSVDAGNNNFLTGDLVNQGTIQVGSSGNAARPLRRGPANGGTINLSGGGTINLNNPNSYLRGYYGNETLVNKDNTIQGQGYIYQLASFQNQGDRQRQRLGRDARRSTAFNTTNTGTLEATGGGTLQIYTSTVTNTGHTISADSTSNLILNAATINGGNLTAASPAVIHGIDNTTLNGVTITSGTTYSVDAGNSNFLTGDLVNEGTIQVGVSGNAAPTSMPMNQANGGTINLSGGGTINLNDANSYLRGYYGNETLVNKDNTIQGQGYIDQLASFQNQARPSTPTSSGGTLYDLRRSTPPTPGRSKPPAAARSRSTPRPSPTRGTRSRPTVPRTSSSMPRRSTAATSPPPAPP